MKDVKVSMNGKSMLNGEVDKASGNQVFDISKSLDLTSPVDEPTNDRMTRNASSTELASNEDISSNSKSVPRLKLSNFNDEMFGDDSLSIESESLI